jgi:hypothetical protein
MAECEHWCLVSRCAEDCDCLPDVPHACRDLSCFDCGVAVAYVGSKLVSEDGKIVGEDG